VDFGEVVRTQRMVRTFDGRPVDDEALDRLLRAATSGPSAGFSQGLELVVLHGPDETARYWDVALPRPARTGFAWSGLLEADVLVVLFTRSAAYLARYGEDDKASTGLGGGTDEWPVPYWYVDAGMAAELLLLAAVDEGLGALFFGMFRRVDEIRAALGVPAELEPVGVVAIGHPAQDRPDRPGRSVARGRRSLDDVVHRGGW
jgi:nitroreductase